MAWIVGLLEMIVGLFKYTDEDVENLQRLEDNLKRMKHDIKRLLDNQIESKEEQNIKFYRESNNSEAHVPSKSAMYYVESENGKRKGSETIVCDNTDAMHSQMQQEDEKIFMDKKEIHHFYDYSNEMIEEVSNVKDRLKSTIRLPFLRRHPSKDIQIFIPKWTKMTESFRSEAERLFQGISSERQICDQYSALSEELHLVVVCPVITRIEVDVDSALEQINYNKPFVVLLLHPGIISSMPHLSTSSKLDRKKYKNIEFIDIAYSTDNKLHDCKMNAEANQMLKKYFRSSSYCTIL